MNHETTIGPGGDYETVAAWEAANPGGRWRGRMIEPTPRTPRIEAGTKVVLPDGQVREIKAVRHVLDEENNRDTMSLIVEFTNRWLPRVS